MRTPEELAEEVRLYRKALLAIQVWEAMRDGPDLRLVRAYAKATLKEVPFEAAAVSAAPVQRASLRTRIATTIRALKGASA